VVNEDVSPELVGFLGVPNDLGDPGLLLKCHHRGPAAPVLGRLNHEGDTACLILTNYFRAADSDGYFELALNKLPDSARVKMEGGAVAHLEVVLVEVVCVVGDLSDFVAYLLVLRVVVPCCQRLVLSARGDSVENPVVQYVLELGLAPQVAEHRRLLLLFAEDVMLNQPA